MARWDYIKDKTTYWTTDPSSPYYYSFNYDEAHKEEIGKESVTRIVSSYMWQEMLREIVNKIKSISISYSILTPIVLEKTVSEEIVYYWSTSVYTYSNIYSINSVDISQYLIPTRAETPMFDWNEFTNLSLPYYQGQTENLDKMKDLINRPLEFIFNNALNYPFDKIDKVIDKDYTINRDNDILSYHLKTTISSISIANPTRKEMNEVINQGKFYEKEGNINTFIDHLLDTLEITINYTLELSNCIVSTTRSVSPKSKTIDDITTEGSIDIKLREL